MQLDTSWCLVITGSWAASYKVVGAWSASKLFKKGCGKVDIDDRGTPVDVLD